MKILFKKVIALTILVTMSFANLITFASTEQPSQNTIEYEKYKLTKEYCKNTEVELTIQYLDGILNTNAPNIMREDNSPIANSIRKLLYIIPNTYPDVVRLQKSKTLADNICSLPADEKKIVLENLQNYVYSIEYFKWDLYITYALFNWDKFTTSEKELLILLMPSDVTFGIPADSLGKPADVKSIDTKVIYKFMKKRLILDTVKTNYDLISKYL